MADTTSSAAPPSPKDETEKNTNNNDQSDIVEGGGEQDTFSVIKNKKSSDSDINSEDLSSNDEQHNVTSNSNSQFYESSDSKIDYAVKIEDNDTLSDIEDIKTDTASADSEDSALGSLPPDSAPNDREEEAQERSDGSDSGIGSETPEDIKEPSFNLALPCSSGIQNKESENQSNREFDKNINNGVVQNDKIVVNDELNVSSTPQVEKPHRSSLKRRHEDENESETQVKRKKETIKFDNVTVFYFPRAQGFSCVPSQGGSTLGMEWEHSHIKNFTLAEHAIEQRRLHRQILQQLKNERHSLQGTAISSSEDSDTEEETSDISESELDLDSYYFLQPVPTRQRRALLRAAGVRKIEGFEKDECRDIRTSREFCGCACKGACNPESCSCSQSGIKCQVDRLNFPCGCTRDGCGNTSGRIEFNPVRVRTHFIQTLMRLGLEKKNEESREAAKRQWVAQNIMTASCASNNAYDRERCQNHNDGLLRDVSLSPRIEVESCVNNGSFNNVHCDVNTNSTQTNVHEEVNYNYRNEAIHTRNMNENSSMHFEDSSSHHSHAEPYTSNILQGKGPPYLTSTTIGFDAMSNNMQRFSCDLNYAYEHHNSENNHFKGSQSFSATRFEEFAHNSQMSMFSHYGQMYVPEYLQKPSTSMHDHSSLQYHTTPHNHYEMYNKTSGCANAENKTDYTQLMTLSTYQASSNKMQTTENDENWFSQNTLMTLDPEQTIQDASELHTSAQTALASTESGTAETTENFGELIKKTMVDSVTV